MNLRLIYYYFYLALFGVTFFDTTPAYSNASCNALFSRTSPTYGKTIIDTADEEAFRGEFEAMAKALEENTFTIDRGLFRRKSESESPGYDDIFSGQTSRDITMLPRDSHIVEIGIGSGEAVFQALKALRNAIRPIPKTTGIAVTLPPEYEAKRTSAISQGVDLSQHRIIQKYLETLSVEEIGLADRVWDVGSANRYTPYLSEVLTKELQILKPGGKFYTVLEAYIFDEFGKQLTADAFAMRIKGVKLVRLNREMTNNLSENAVILFRESGPIEVPNLKLEFFSGSIPPLRVYRIVP